MLSAGASCCISLIWEQTPGLFALWFCSLPFHVGCTYEMEWTCLIFLYHIDLSSLDHLCEHLASSVFLSGCRGFEEWDYMFHSMCSVPSSLRPPGAHHSPSSFSALPHSLDHSQAHSPPLQLPFLHGFLPLLRYLSKSSHFLTRSSQWKHLPHCQRLGAIRRATVVIAGVCGSVIHSVCGSRMPVFKNEPTCTISLMSRKEE